MKGEEIAALAAYREARKRHPGLRLVLVPRHAERFEDVASLLEAQGERVVRRSRDKIASAPGEPPPVVLIDTIGDLGAAWGLADVAFVGGSLFPGRGGQNMMEPAAFGASVLFGPYTSNFRETVEQLLARDAARRVVDARDLARTLLEDLDNPEAATVRGEAARAFVLAQNGASARTFAEIDRLVESRLQ
jgi:3-deoxy-D-manno-octulosonic-acid transferase